MFILYSSRTHELITGERMYVINAEFRSLHTVSVGECINHVGVYVLWSRNAYDRPSYIGEGNVLARVLSHLMSPAKPFHDRKVDGCIAIIDAGHPKASKRDAQIVEVTLLTAADRLNVFPKHNKAPGNLNAVFKRAGYDHDTVRINVRGMHPLRIESGIRGTATLAWRWNDDFGWELTDMPWRRVG